MAIVQKQQPSRPYRDSNGYASAGRFMTSGVYCRPGLLSLIDTGFIAGM